MASPLFQALLQNYRIVLMNGLSPTRADIEVNENNRVNPILMLVHLQNMSDCYGGKRMSTSDFLGEVTGSYNDRLPSLSLAKVPLVGTPL